MVYNGQRHKGRETIQNTNSHSSKYFILSLGVIIFFFSKIDTSKEDLSSNFFKKSYTRSGCETTSYSMFMCNFCSCIQLLSNCTVVLETNWHFRQIYFHPWHLLFRGLMHQVQATFCQRVSVNSFFLMFRGIHR